MLAYLTQSALLSLLFISASTKSETELGCSAVLCASRQTDSTGELRRRFFAFAGVSLVTVDDLLLAIYAHLPLRAHLTNIYFCRMPAAIVPSHSLLGTYCIDQLDFHASIELYLTSSACFQPVPPAPIVTNPTGRLPTKTLCKWNTHAFCVI